MLKKTIYIAAPLFSQAERQFNVAIVNKLEEYFDVFLPQRDGGIFVDLVANGMAIADAAKTTFIRDLTAIEKADVVLIVLDGRTIDEGACFELGIGFSKGKKCIALQTDTRRLLPVGNNPMIECAVDRVFENVESLVAWAHSYAGGTAVRR